MRRLILFFFSCLSVCAAVAQNPTTPEGWAQRLQLFGQKVPQEEVFIHMDNTCYYLGDTLYFKAYMRLSDGRPSPLSQLLYVELLNQDGYLVERQKIEMQKGQGHGSFVLPDTLYGGYYELRAYTRWQLNWGLYEHPHTKNAEKWFFSKKMAHDYYRDYEKLYSRVFPVYDKPREPGGYFQDMTTRPLHRVFKQKEAKPKAVVTFYPEGGNLVAGVPNRVAFEARDEEGKHLKGKFKIRNAKSRIDVEAETVSRGRGTFIITPADVDDAMEAVFEWDGNTEECRLPKAVTDGVAMQATVGDEGITVRWQPRGAAATEPLGLTASCHGVLKDFVNLSPDTNEILIPQAKLPTGVIQLTVFNGEGRVYADRLVFVRQPDFQPQNISLEGVKPQYAPYEQVEVTLKALSTPLPGKGEGATVSLAVRDAAHSDYTFDSGNILTEMLLASQIRGFVEQPEYFFEKDDEEHRRALDLLLMVQGWRRYGWREMAVPGAFALTQPYEKTEVLTGEVNTYFSEEQEDIVGRELQLQSISDFNDPELKNIIERAVVKNGLRYTDVVGAPMQMDDSMVEGRKQSGDAKSLQGEVLLHAEFIQPKARQGESMVVGDMETYGHGNFRIEAPRFSGACLLSLAASDSTKWKKGTPHGWMESSEDKRDDINYPEFYVKLNSVFPRFVKPYDFYQETLPTSRMRAGRRLLVDDDAILMDEVTVGARRGGLRHFDISKPAYVVDAYEAFNDACDAGLCPGYFIGHQRFLQDIARTYVGDMNMERAYSLNARYDTKARFRDIAIDWHLILWEDYAELMQLKSAAGALISPMVLNQFNHLPNLDMVYIYTDYSPRREGDKRFIQDNQPTVTVDLRRFADGGQRMIYRDRRLVLTGYAVCEDFYQPDYSKQQPTEPTDYRRTLYWNPDVKLDAEGRATVRFFNNSQKTQLTVSAEGMAADGELLTGISYPEE